MTQQMPYHQAVAKAIERIDVGLSFYQGPDKAVPPRVVELRACLASLRALHRELSPLPEGAPPPGWQEGGR